MYHYAREGKDRQSWPSVETICEKLAMTKETVYKWRSWLISNGWLVKVGERENGTGIFKVPIIKVTRGSVPQQQVVDGRRANVPPVPGRKTSNTAPSRKKSETVGRKNSNTARLEKFQPEVEPELQVNPFEVEAAAFFLHEGTNTETLNKHGSARQPVAAPSRKNSNTVVQVAKYQPHEVMAARRIVQGLDKPSTIYAPHQTMEWAEQVIESQAGKSMVPNPPAASAGTRSCEQC
jgi:hypothetical protein